MNARADTGTAPFFGDLAEGPEGGRAIWLTTDDDVRLRLAVWPKGRRGTVLMFPGRTEYAEKYGRAAAELAARGYASVALDWRGQGLADRILPDAMIGHVGQFTDYQRDVAAALQAVQDLGLPGPFFLIAHSMGGCILLRAAMQGLSVRAAVFSAPMWGIAMTPATRPFAWALTRLAEATGQGHRLSPGMRRQTYVSFQPFENNTLTTDRDSFQYMQRQVGARPELALGGPSLHWLGAAMAECRTLAAMPSPGLPAMTFLGQRERVVDSAAIRNRMARWPNGRLVMVDGAEHEVIMESAAIRRKFFDESCAFFAAQA